MYIATEASAASAPRVTAVIATLLERPSILFRMTADSIEREGTDAVLLFWRFMIEKYGLHPGP